MTDEEKRIEELRAKEKAGYTREELIQMQRERIWGGSTEGMTITRPGETPPSTKPAPFLADTHEILAREASLPPTR